MPGPHQIILGTDDAPIQPGRADTPARCRRTQAPLAVAIGCILAFLVLGAVSQGEDVRRIQSRRKGEALEHVDGSAT